MLEDIMDWLDAAVQIEIEGEAFYRELAENAETEGMKNIFLLLADAELRHKNQFEAMKEGKETPESEDNFRESVREIFKSFQKEDGKKEQKHQEVYQKALEVEKNSIDFYSQQLETVEDAHQKQVLEKIIEEERSHFSVIDTLVVMVERPERWVEYAEFGLREDY